MDYSVKILKQTDDTATIGGYGVVFGGRDLQGETFTKDTDFMLDLVPVKPIYYDHTVNAVKNQLGKVIEITIDDIGAFVKSEIDKHAEYAAAVLKLVEQGVLGYSSGSVSHLVRYDGNMIKTWPWVETSLTVTPAEPRTVGIERIKQLADGDESLKALLKDMVNVDDNATATEPEQDNIMPGLPAESEDSIMADKQQKQPDTTPALSIDEISQAMKTALDPINKRIEKLEDKPVNAIGVGGDAAKGVNVVMDTDHWKYDNYPLEDISLAMSVIKSAEGRRAVSDGMTKAFYHRLYSEEATKNINMRDAVMRAKGLGIKANEANFSTNVGFGDEWIGVAYSSNMWEKVRQQTFVLEQLSAGGGAIVAPPGAESIVFPLEGTDPEWFTVAQSGDPSNATAQIANTVPAKALGTGSVTATLAKSGTSVIYTGEMVEDAVLPFVSALQRQLVTSGAEIMEAIFINGDTAAGATTNINDIGGTPAATDWFMALNGFRKLCLVTNAANSRDGGAIASADFIETLKLMGDAGLGGIMPGKSGFILDPFTHYKAVQLADVKSQDVFSGATIESGMLTGIYGSKVFVSGQMHKGATNLLANTAGKVDLDTQGNNTTGAILAVRWDQWRYGYRRDMTIETQRFPRADAWEITALMRYHLSARDTEASAISYNLTV